MKTYRLKKDIIGAKKWMEFGYSYGEITWQIAVEWKSLWQVMGLIRAVWIENTEYFEKVKEVEFKVGDYAVYGNNSYTDYIKYIKIDGITIYNDWDIFYNWYKPEDLRKPTQEELNLYFR